MGIYKTYKNIGETPLECLKRIVKDYNIPDSEKVMCPVSLQLNVRSKNPVLLLVHSLSLLPLISVP